MKILGIDSSTEIAAISLIDDENLLAEMNLSLYRRHSERLMPNIEHLFKELNTSIQEIDAIALTTGPGSFTGLRIALSTVKGFAAALDIPVVALSTLEVLAYNYCQTEAMLIPMIDARRERVYTALFNNYSTQSPFKEKRLWEDKTLRVEDLIEELEIINQKEEDKKYIFIGSAANKYKDKIKNSNLNYNFGSIAFNKIRGAVIAELGKKYLKAGISHNVAKLVPNYLKKPQAEINFKKIGSE